MDKKILENNLQQYLDSKEYKTFQAMLNKFGRSSGVNIKEWDEKLEKSKEEDLKPKTKSNKPLKDTKKVEEKKQEEKQEDEKDLKEFKPFKIIEEEKYIFDESKKTE